MEFIAQTNHTVYLIIINVVWQIGVCLFYNMSSLLGGLSSSNVYSSMVKAALEEEENGVAWVVETGRELHEFAVFLRVGRSGLTSQINLSITGKRNEGGTYGRMGRLVVNMYKCTADIRQDLYLVLETLAEVVGLPERRVRVHHDVYFDEIVRSTLTKVRAREE